MRYGDEVTADYFVVIFALLSDSRKVLMSYSCLYSNAIQQFDFNSHVIQRVIAVGEYQSSGTASGFSGDQ